MAKPRSTEPQGRPVSVVLEDALQRLDAAPPNTPGLVNLAKSFVKISDALQSPDQGKLEERLTEIKKELPKELKPLIPDFKNMGLADKVEAMQKLQTARPYIVSMGNEVKASLTPDGKSFDPAKFEAAKKTIRTALDPFLPEKPEVAEKREAGITGDKGGPEVAGTSSKDVIKYDAKKVSGFLRDLVDSKGSNDRAALSGLMKELKLGDGGATLDAKAKDLKGKYGTTDATIDTVREVAAKLKEKGKEFTAQDAQALSAKLKERGLDDGSKFIGTKEENKGVKTAKDLKDARTDAQRVAAEGHIHRK